MAIATVVAVEIEMTDWARISGTRWYRPEVAQAAAKTLAAAGLPERAAQAVVDLRHAVSNDHGGSLYPAAVPAVGVFLRVIAEWPGEPRGYALDALLDWWGCFVPEPGFEIYDGSDAPEGCRGSLRWAARRYQ